jgi:hypothetical protein
VTHKDSDFSQGSSGHAWCKPLKYAAKYCVLWYIATAVFRLKFLIYYVSLLGHFSISLTYKPSLTASQLFSPLPKQDR